MDITSIEYQKALYNAKKEVKLNKELLSGEVGITIFILIIIGIIFTIGVWSSSVAMWVKSGILMIVYMVCFVMPITLLIYMLRDYIKLKILERMDENMGRRTRNYTKGWRRLTALGVLFILISYIITNVLFISTFSGGIFSMLLFNAIFLGILGIGICVTGWFVN